MWEMREWTNEKNIFLDFLFVPDMISKATPWRQTRQLT